MHQVGISQEIIDRVMARRGRLHVFDRLDPAETAIIIIDMQQAFCGKGAPAEVPLSRGIVAPINRLTAGARALGVPVIFVTHAIRRWGERNEWSNFIDHFVSDDTRERTLQSMIPGTPAQAVWHELTVEEDDIQLVKNRYSSLTPSCSQLERVLRSLGTRNLIITGTKTNVCCESTTRDAMMLDFRPVLVSDATAALSDREHQSALENVIQQFGDVYTTDEVLDLLRQGRRAG